MNGSDVSKEPNIFVFNYQAVHKPTQRRTLQRLNPPLLAPEMSLHHTSDGSRGDVVMVTRPEPIPCHRLSPQ